MLLVKKFINWLEYNEALFYLLISELLLFAAFNLMDAGVIFQNLAILLMIATFPLMLRNLNPKSRNNLLSLGIPLLVFLTILGVFNMTYASGWGSAIQNILLILGLAAFFVLGFNFASFPTFHISQVAKFILLGLGLITLISFIYTMYRYAPFYVTRFAGDSLYFDGERYYVSLEAKWLFGINFKEVKVGYFSQYALVLTSGLIGLGFYPFKKAKIKEVLFFGLPIIGLIALIFLPNLKALFFLFPALILILLFEFYPRNKKAIKILGIGLFTLLGIFSISAFILSMYGLKAGFVVNLIENNVILRKLYGNSIVSGYAEILGGLLLHPWGGNKILIHDLSSITTGSFFFDSLNQGGILAGLALLIFLIFLGKNIYEYLQKSEDEKFLKYMLVGLVVTYFTYTIFKYELFPFVRELERNIVIPFLYDFFLMPVLFLSGYFGFRRPNLK